MNKALLVKQGHQQQELSQKQGPTRRLAQALSGQAPITPRFFISRVLDCCFKVESHAVSCRCARRAGQVLPVCDLPPSLSLPCGSFNAESLH